VLPEQAVAIFSRGALPGTARITEYACTPVATVNRTWFAHFLPLVPSEGLAQNPTGLLEGRAATAMLPTRALRVWLGAAPSALELLKQDTRYILC